MDGFLFSAGVIVPANSVLVFSRDRGDQRNAATFTGREATSGECNSGLLLGSRTRSRRVDRIIWGAELSLGTESLQTLRWREPDSNLRYRGRRRACGRSLRAQRVETDPAKGSSDQTVACLRRLAAGVVSSAAACAFRFRPPGTGSKRAGWRRSGAIVRLLRGGVLRTGCFLRQAAVQGGHEIDDGWRGRDLPGFNGEPLHLGFELAFGHAELRRPNLLCGTQSEKRHPRAARLDDDHPLAPA